MTGSRAACGSARCKRATRSRRACWTARCGRSAPGVASCLNVLDVEAVVIGGGLGVRLGPTYLERFTLELMTHLFAPVPPAVRIAELGDLGGAIGGSLLVKSASQSRKPAAAK